MITINTLDSAIAAHSLWKSRLHQAIETGKCDVVASDARRDDVCAFGKWLASEPQSDAHYKTVRDLHHRFHAAVAKVLELALAGRKADALKLVDESGDYAQTSTQLVREMMAWKRQLA